MWFEAWDASMEMPVADGPEDVNGGFDPANFVYGPDGLVTYTNKPFIVQKARMDLHKDNDAITIKADILGVDNDKVLCRVVMRWIRERDRDLPVFTVFGNMAPGNRITEQQLKKARHLRLLLAAVVWFAAGKDTFEDTWAKRVCFGWNATKSEMDNLTNYVYDKKELSVTHTGYNAIVTTAVMDTSAWNARGKWTIGVTITTKTSVQLLKMHWTGAEDDDWNPFPVFEVRGDDINTTLKTLSPLLAAVVWFAAGNTKFRYTWKPKP
jgi:hypothetical protein